MPAYTAQPGARPDLDATFVPTSEWQDVPEGAICPAGLQIRVDMTTGRTQARLMGQEQACAPGSPRDAVTVYTSVDGRPINKIVRRLPDGSIAKGMVEHQQDYFAEHVPVPDLAALGALMAAIGARSDQMHSTSLFVDPPASRWRTTAVCRLPSGGGARPVGWHTTADGEPICGRLLENMRHGAYLGFDLDPDKDAPQAMQEWTLEERFRAIGMLFPGFEACGKLLVPSTSTRVLVDGKPLAGGMRVFVKVSDPDLIDVKWAQAMLRALITSVPPTPWDDGGDVPLAFLKRKFSRAQPGLVVGLDWRTVCDRCTGHVNRLWFDGKPVVEGEGLSVAPGKVEVRPGPPLDLPAVKDLTKEEGAAVIAACAALKGVKPRIVLERAPGARGRSPVLRVSMTVHDLEWDTPLDLGGSWTTVRELHAAKAGHTRCQSPFRESNSEAAYYNTHGDGRPFVFDSGTGEKHVLRYDRNPTMRELLYEWLVHDYDPILANADQSAFYSHRRKGWVKARDISLAGEDLLDLLAEGRDAPRDKDDAVKMFAVAQQAGTWLKFARGDLIRNLPTQDDDDANLPDEIRQAEHATFTQQVASLLAQMVFGEGEECTSWGHTKRSLGTWVHYLAEKHPKQWRRFGSRHVLGMIDERGFHIAMRPELAEQVGTSAHAEIKAMVGTNKFSRMAERAGIRDNSRTSVFTAESADDEKSKRWTILTVAFVAALDISTDHGTSGPGYQDHLADGVAKTATKHGLGSGRGYLGQPETMEEIREHNRQRRRREN